MLSQIGADLLECLLLEAGCAHPRLDGRERILDRAEAEIHSLRVHIEPALDRLENVIVLSTDHATLVALGAASLDRVVLANIGPVRAYRQSVFHGCEAMCQALAGGADIDVVIADIAEVLLHEHAFETIARGQRLGQGAP